MRTKIIFIIVLCSVSSEALSYTSKDSTRAMPEFRNIPWSSSIKEVREKENAYYLQNFSGFGVTALSFKDKLAGIEARIDYTFKNDQFTEGAYIIKPGNLFKNNFVHLLEFLTVQYSNPEYRSGPLYTLDTFWIKENNYGRFSGPAFYWVFNDGFISLLSQKFEDDITITVLFVHGSSIENYAKNNGVELSNFFHKVIEK